MAKPPRGKQSTKNKPARAAKPVSKAKKAKPAKATKAKAAPKRAKPAAKKPAAKKAAKATPAAKKPVAARKPAPVKPAAHKAAARPRARKSTSQLSLPGFSAPSSDDDGEPASGDDRASHIAQLAAARAADPSAPVRLASITAPSGTLAIFDVALMAYLPREALDPLMVCIAVPRDRPLDVIGMRVGAGRFADCWHHLVIELAAGGRDVARTRKLGDAAVDFSRLMLIDRAAIDGWQHEDSLDGRADVVFWGRDEAALAKTMGARKLVDGQGRGWRDLSLADAESRADRAAQLKAEHGLQVTVEVQPHSHHYRALAAARASGHGAGTIDLGDARAALVVTSWGDGLFPVELDLDAADQPLRIRILLAPSDPSRRSAA